jgi:hypothetical protein
MCDCQYNSSQHLLQNVWMAIAISCYGSAPAAMHLFLTQQVTLQIKCNIHACNTAAGHKQSFMQHCTSPHHAVARKHSAAAAAANKFCCCLRFTPEQLVGEADVASTHGPAVLAMVVLRPEKVPRQHRTRQPRVIKRAAAAPPANVQQQAKLLV